MHIHKRRSFFPLVITLLTMSLIVFMFYAFMDASSPATEPMVEEVITVNADDYRSDTVLAIANFEEGYGQAADDLSRLMVTETALEELLDLRVPAEYKELHLDLVVALNQLQTALRSEGRSTAEALAGLEALKIRYPWIEG